MKNNTILLLSDFKKNHNATIKLFKYSFSTYLNYVEYNLFLVLVCFIQILKIT